MTGVNAPAAEGMRSIAWGKKVSVEFRAKMIAICGDLGCNPDHLMAAMAFETGETFRPDIKNKISGATGLIQFMPATARQLGTTTDALAAMSAVEQLDYVARYFRSQRGRLKSVEDVYMAILWPAAVGKPNDFILFASPSQAYIQNKGLDYDHDNRVTKLEAAQHVRLRLSKGLQPGFIG